MRTRPAPYKKTPYKDLKLTKLCLGPIYTHSEAILGFLFWLQFKSILYNTSDILKVFFLRHSIFTFKNFAQENAYKVGKNEQKVQKSCH